MVTLEIRQQERIVNAALADLLRNRYDLDAQAEVHVAGRYPDVLINLPSGPVILETEFAPAYSVDDDALAKLGLPVSERSAEVTFAIVLPVDLKVTHQRDLRGHLANSLFQWTTWYTDATSDPRKFGDLQTLTTEVKRATSKGDDVAKAVNILEEGARDAGSMLYSKHGSMARVSRIFEREPSNEVANMAALMVINAMVFHNRLSSAVSLAPPPRFRIPTILTS